MCVGCGEMKAKNELIRIVKSKDDIIEIDKSGKAAGRGAYICKSPCCLETARKKGRLAKSFKMKIPEEVFEKISEEQNG